MNDIAITIDSDTHRAAHDRGKAALLLARSLACLDDRELLGRLEQLVRQRHKVTVELVIHLSEVEHRKLQLAQACPSMFVYCTDRLHLSESSAYKHIRAARLSRQFPLLLEYLAEGKVHLTAIGLLSSELTEDNHRELLEAATHKSKRDVELLLADRHPKPDVRSTIRMLPEPRPGPRPSPKPQPEQDAGGRPESPGLDQELEPGLRPATPPAAITTTAAAAPTAAAAAPTAAAAAPTAATVVPLGSRRFRVQFTASASLCDKMRQAQALMRRELPNGDLGGIVERALDVLLADLGRRKLAQTERPRSPKPVGTTHTRHIPNAVKRAVVDRDGMRCAFVDKLGRRCTETGLLELHHREPFALGGDPTVHNLELRCRAHHRWETEQSWGAAIVEERPRGQQAARAGQARGPVPEMAAGP